MALDRMNKLEDELRKVLPDSMQGTLDEFLRTPNTLSDLACEEDFETGYQLGVQMLMAGLNGELPEICKKLMSE